MRCILLIDPGKSTTNKKVHRVNDNNVISLASPATVPLNEVLKQGAQQLLSQAIEAEVQSLLAGFADVKVSGKQAVVRNGHLPERQIKTGLGDIAVKVPKVRDRSCQGIKFNSTLILLYLKRTKSLDEFIPWLYLKGISTGDMQPALSRLLGENATGLSANTESRLKQSWEQDYDIWRKRDLSRKLTGKCTVINSLFIIDYTFIL